MFNRKLKEHIAQLDERIRILQKRCDDYDCAAGKHRYGYLPYGFYSVQKCLNCGHIKEDAVQIKYQEILHRAANKASNMHNELIAALEKAHPLLIAYANRCLAPDMHERMREIDSIAALCEETLKKAKGEEHDSK